MQAEGQGIIQKTPDSGRYEGAQEVTVTATPATGWVFAGWQGDVTGIDNPLTLDLASDLTIVAVFNEALDAPVVTDGAICGPGAVTLQASGAVGTQTYVWYAEPSGGNPIPGQSSATFVTPELGASATYYVALASLNSEGPRAAVQATILMLPAQPAITAEGDLNCPDEMIPTVLHAPAGFSGYLWSTDETTPQIQAIAAGAYSVRVMDDNGCLSDASAEVILRRTTPGYPRKYSQHIQPASFKPVTTTM